MTKMAKLLETVLNRSKSSYIRFKSISEYNL